jgi:hypothetical protein
VITPLGNLKPGTQYAVQFIANGPGGATAASQTYTFTTGVNQPHPKPINPVLTYTTGNITLSWDHGVEPLLPDFDGYIVEVWDNAVVLGRYGVADAKKFEFTLALNDSLSVTPIPDPTFKVWARDKSGQLSSTSMDATAAYPVLAAPGAGAHVAVVNGINWKWTEPATGAGNETKTVDYYEVDVDADGLNTPFVNGADVEARVYGFNYLYIDSPGTQYDAHIRAVDVFGRPGAHVSTTLMSGTDQTGGTPDSTPPTLADSVTITNQNITQDGMASFVANWPSAVDSDGTILGYYVRIKSASDTAWSSFFASTSTLTHVFKSLTANVSYTVEVAAVNAAGLLSAWRAATTTTLATAAPAVISGTVTADWSTSDLVITFGDSRTVGSEAYFSHYDVEITYNTIVKTFRASLDKRVVISPSQWVSIWGQNTGLLYGNIKVWAVNAFGMRDTTGKSPTSLGALPALAAGGAPSIHSIIDGKVSFTWTASTSKNVVKYEVIALSSLNGATAPTSANIVQTVSPQQIPAPPIALTVGTNTHRFQVATIVTDLFGRTQTSAVYTSPIQAAQATPVVYPGIDVMKVVFTTTSGAYRYDVYAGTPAASTLIASVTDATREVSWLTNGSTAAWLCDVFPYNVFGTVGAKGTDGETAITVVAADGIAPAQIAGLVADNTPGTTTSGVATLQLQWTVPVAADLDKYEIRWTTALSDMNWSSAEFAKVNATAGGTETYYLRGLVPGTPYRVQVAPLDTSGNRGTWTDSVLATTAAVPTIETPVGSVSGSFTTPDLNISWTDTQTYSPHFWGYEVRITNDAWITYKSWRTTQKAFTLTRAENKAVFGGTGVTSFASGAVRVYAVSIYGTFSTQGAAPAGAIASTGAYTNAAPTNPGTPNFTGGYVAGGITATWTAETAADFYRYKVVITFSGISRTYYVYDKTVNKFTLTFDENRAVFGGVSNPAFLVTTEDLAGVTTAGASAAASYPTLGTIAAPTGTPFLEGISWAWSQPATTVPPTADIVDYYDIDIEPAAGDPTTFSTIDGANLKTLTFAKPGLTGGASYTAAVRARDIFGRTAVVSIESASYQALSNSGDSTIPTSAPTWTMVPATDYAGVSSISGVITYDQAVHATDFSHYVVQWGTVAATYTHSLVTVNKNYTIPNLLPNTTYKILIRAVDKGGNANNGSAETSDATPVRPTIATPTGSITATWVGNDLSVSWTDNTSYAANTFGKYRLSITSTGGTGIWETTAKSILIKYEDYKQKLGVADSQLGTSDIVLRSVHVLDPTQVSGTLTPTVAANKGAPAPATNLTLTAAIGSMTAQWRAPTSGADIVEYRVYAKSGSYSAGTGTTDLVYRGPGTSTTFVTETSASPTNWYVSVYADDGFDDSGSSTVLQQFATGKLLVSGIQSPANSVVTGTGKVQGVYNSPNLVLTWLDTQTYTPELFNGYRVTITANSKTYSWDVPQIPGVSTDVRGRLVLDQTEQFQAFGAVSTSYAQGAVVVHARDVNNKLSASSIANNLAAIVNAAPDAPTSPIATAGSTSVTYSWTEPNNDDVKNGAGSYNVTLWTNAGRTVPFAARPNFSTRVPNFTLSGFTPNTTYYTRIYSVDTVGTQSALPLEGSFLTQTIAGDATPPAGVTALDSTTVTPKIQGKYDVTISWASYTPAETISEYVIRWGTGSAGVYTNSLTVPGGAAGVTAGTGGLGTATIAGLTRGSTVRYKVIPVDSSGNQSTASTEFNSTLAAYTPGTPSTFEYTWTNVNNLTLTWVAPSTAGGLTTDIAGYEVTLTGANGTHTYTTPTNSFVWTHELNRASGLTTNAYTTSLPANTGVSIKAYTDTSPVVKSATGLTNGASAVNHIYDLAWPVGGGTPNLTVTAYVGQMRAVWGAVTGAEQYNVYSDTSNPPTTRVFRTSLLQAEWATTGTTAYRTRVAPVDLLGTQSSGTPPTAESTTTQLAQFDTNTNSAIPGAVTLTNVTPVAGTNGTASINVSWLVPTDASRVRNYKIRYTDDLNGGSQPTYTGARWSFMGTSGTELFATIDGLRLGRTYYVQVASVDFYNNVSTYSESPADTITTPGTAQETVDVTFSSTARLRSSSYPTSGWELSNNALDIKNGTISAATLLIGGTGTNLMPPAYADFEYETAGYTDPTRSFHVTVIGTATRSIDVAAKAIGGYGLQFVTTAANSGVQLARNGTTYNIPLSPNTEYILSFYARQTSGSAKTLNVLINQDVGGTIVATAQSILTSTATRYQVTFTTGGSANRANLSFTAASATATTWGLDGVMVEQKLGASATPSAFNVGTLSKIDGGSISAQTINADVFMSGTSIITDLIIGTGGLIQSQNYSANTSGFKVAGDAGSAEFNDVTIRNNFEIGPATGNRVIMDETGIDVVEVVNSQDTPAITIDVDGIHGYKNSAINGGVVSTKTFEFDRTTGRVTAGGATLRTRISERLPIDSRSFDPVARTETFVLPSRHGISVGDSVRVTDLWDENIPAFSLVAIGTGLVQSRAVSPLSYTYKNGCNVKISSGNKQLDRKDWSVYGHGQLQAEISSYYSVQSSFVAGNILSITALGANVGDEIEIKTNIAHGLTLGQPFVITGLTAAAITPYSVTNFSNPFHKVTTVVSSKTFRCKRVGTGNMPTGATSGVLKYNHWRFAFGDPHPFVPGDGSTNIENGLVSSLKYRNSVFGGAGPDTFQSVTEAGVPGTLGMSYENDSAVRSSISPTTSITAQSTRYASSGFVYIPDTGYNPRFLSFLSDVESLYTIRPTVPTTVSAKASFSNGTFRVVNVTDTTVTVKNNNVPVAFPVTSISDLSSGRRTVTVTGWSGVMAECMPGQTITITGTSGLNETAVVYSTTLNTVVYTSAIGAGVTGGAQGSFYTSPASTAAADISSARIELVTPGVVIEESAGSAYIAIPSGSEDTSESPATISGVKTQRRKRSTISAASRTAGTSPVLFTTVEKHGLAVGDYVEIVAQNISSGAVGTVTLEPVPVTAIDSLNNTFTCTPNTQTTAVNFSTASTPDVSNTVERVIPIHRVRTASISGNNYRRIGNYFLNVTTTDATDSIDTGTEPVTQAFYTPIPHGLKNGERVEIKTKSGTFNYSFPRLRVKSDREFWVLGGEGHALASDSRPRRWALPEANLPWPTVSGAVNYTLTTPSASVVSISSGTTTRTITMSTDIQTSNDTRVYPGMSLYITGSTVGSFNGRIVVSRVLSGTQFQFDSSHIPSGDSYVSGAVLNRHFMYIDIGTDTAQDEFSVGDMIAIQSNPDTINQYSMIRGIGNSSIDPTSTHASLTARTKEVLYVDSKYSTANGYPEHLSTEKFTLVVVKAEINGWDTTSRNLYVDSKMFDNPGVGVVYIYDQEKPQIEIASPTSILERVPASITMEPGTVRKTSGQSGFAINTNRAGMVTENDAAYGGDIPDASEASIASTSRIILTAGEVVLSGNYGQVVQVNLHSGWTVYDGFGGLNVHQEVDGWWSMSGLLARANLEPPDPVSENQIGVIESKFAWPKQSAICIVPVRLSGFLHFAHLRITTTGLITFMHPSFIPTNTGLTASAANTAASMVRRNSYLTVGGDSGDWVSLNGMRWKTS